LSSTEAETDSPCVPSNESASKLVKCYMSVKWGLGHG
jgi:hypothetical protein